MDMTDTAKFDLRLMIFHGSSFDTDERMKRAGAPRCLKGLDTLTEWKTDAEVHQGKGTGLHHLRIFKTDQQVTRLKQKGSPRCLSHRR